MIYNKFLRGLYETYDVICSKLNNNWSGTDNEFQISLDVLRTFYAVLFCSILPVLPSQYLVTPDPNKFRSHASGNLRNEGND